MSIELFSGIVFGAAVGFLGAIIVLALAREIVERLDDLPPRE